MNPHDDEFEDAPGEDEVLVAYLDGQLSAGECEHIESLLASDAATRRRLQELDRVWNALDALPRSTASAAFTRTTIDMAAVTASHEPMPSGTRAGFRWRLPLWAAMAAAGVAAGAGLTFLLVSAPERRALLDLPVAIHASALDQSGSMEFLTRLHAEQAADVAAFRDDKVREAAQTWGVVAEATTRQRREWVQSLTPVELTTVNARVAEFQSRPAAKQTSLRAMAEAIAAQPGAAELRETALAYEAMVRRLSSSQQANLRQMPVDERLRLIDRESRRWSRDASLDLSGAEVAEFRDAVDALTESDSYQEVIDDFVRLIESLRENFSRRGPDRLGEGFSKRIRESIDQDPQRFLTGITLQIAGGGQRWGWFGRGGFDLERVANGEQFKKKTHESWRAWVETLADSLPERAAAALRSADDDAERARRLSHLLRQTQGEDDLPTAFARLDPERMDSLLLEPSDEFRDTLAGSNLAGPDFPPGGDWRDGPPGFPGPPGEGVDRRPFPQGPRDFGRRPPPGFGSGPPPGGMPPEPPPR